MNTIDKFKNWQRKIRWNKQYRKGRWNSLRSDRERIRYETITKHINKYGKNNPDILDLGCGEGILFEHISNNNYNSFLGMDFSSVSIKKANKIKTDKSEFICEDIHSFVPNKKYDVIIFNEIFYYINETEKPNVLNIMKKHLKEDGVFIISIYREGHGCWNYFDNNNYQKLKFETITTDRAQTYWKIGAYKPIL